MTPEIAAGILTVLLTIGVVVFYVVGSLVMVALIAGIGYIVNLEMQEHQQRTQKNAPKPAQPSWVRSRAYQQGWVAGQEYADAEPWDNDAARSANLYSAVLAPEEHQQWDEGWLAGNRHALDHEGWA